MQSKSMLLLIAAGAVAGFGALGVTAMLRDRSPDAGVAAPTSESNATTELRAPEELASARDEVVPEPSQAEPEPAEISAEPAAAAAPDPIVEENVIRPPDFGKRERTPSAVFEQKYAGYSEAELAAAKAAVGEAFEADKRAAFQERYQAGLYDVFPIDPANPPTFKATADDVLFQGRKLKADEIRYVWLPFDQYPELYDLNDEYFWLLRKSH